MVTAPLDGARKAFPAFLLFVALLGGLFYSGDDRYILSLVWLALFLWTVYLLVQHEKVEIRLDITAVAMLCFTLWLVLSLLWHPAVFYGLISSWRLGIFPFVFFVTVYLIRDQDVAGTINALLLLGVIIGLASLYQSFVLGHAPTGTLINKNNNAAYLNLSLLPVFSLLLFRDNRGYKRWFASFAFVVLLLAVLQVASRGALISLAIAAIPLLLIAYRRGMSHQFWWLLILVSLVFLLKALMSNPGTWVKTDLASSQVRWYLISSTLEMIRDSGFVGAGADMWRHYYPQYRSIHDTSAGYLLHNDFLQITYELGIVGIMLLLSFGALLSYRFFLIVKLERDMEQLALYLGLFAAVTAVAIHSLVTFNFYIAGTLLIMGFYSGLILRRSLQLKAEGVYTQQLVVTEKKAFIALVVLLMLGKSVLLPGYADAMSRDLLGTTISKLAPLDQYHLYLRLMAYDPGSTYYPSAAAMTLARTGNGMAQQQRRDILQKSRALFHVAALQNKVATDVYVNEARLLSMFSDVAGDDWREEAIALVSKALAMDDAAVASRLFLARLVADGGDKQKALEIMLVRHDHPNNMMMSYYKYGRKLAVELGNSDAERIFKELIDNYPDDYPQW